METKNNPPKEMEDTKFTFKIGENACSCYIEDTERNTFNIDISVSPVDIQLELAGEMEGMIPKAISNNPIDPRVFIMNRPGDCVEIIPAKEPSVGIYYTLIAYTSMILVNIVYIRIYTIRI